MVDTVNKKIESLLYTLNTFSRVMSERCLAALCQDPHIKVAAVTSHWQCVGGLIGSGFELHTSRTRGRRLTTCTI